MNGMSIRHLRPLSLLLLLGLLLLTACAHEPELNQLKESDVVFQITPSSPKAGEEAKLHMELPTLTDTENVDVYYEVKAEGSEKREIFTAMQYEPGKYVTSLTVKQPGAYELSLHIQTIEVHLIFYRTLTVTP
jgi:hypothetical protein